MADYNGRGSWPDRRKQNKQRLSVSAAEAHNKPTQANLAGAGKVPAEGQTYEEHTGLPQCPDLELRRSHLEHGGKRGWSCTGRRKPKYLIVALFVYTPTREGMDETSAV